MKVVIRVLVALVLCGSIIAQQHPMQNQPAAKKATLMANGNAAEAEKVFRKDLERNPRNPRSLFGLAEALRAQNRAYDAQFVDKQFQSN